MQTHRASFGIVLVALSLVVAVITLASAPHSTKAQRETKANQNLVGKFATSFSFFLLLRFRQPGVQSRRRHVTLEGQVTRPTLKSDAEAASRASRAFPA